MEYIICSAIYINDSKVYSDQPSNIKIGYIISGRRHNNCYSVLNCILGRKGMDEVLAKSVNDINHQGFITSMNRYLNREEAFVIAKENNQLLAPNLYDKSRINILTSECIFPTDWENFSY